MFEDLLYLLRRNGLKVSLTEWMALMEGLHKNLHNASFTGFYHLARCLLVKSEADFDAFDRTFLEYFKDVPFQQEVSQELLDWLNKPDVLSDYANWDEIQALKNLGAVLTEGGMTFADVAKTTCFLADIKDFAAFNAIYAEYFKGEVPARSCFAVKDLPMGGLVEIEAIAVK